MRKLKRSIARETMKKVGFTHLNKKRARTEVNPTGKSVFAEHWKDYVFFMPDPKGKKKRKGLPRKAKP